MSVVRESCREWIDDPKFDRCNRPAVVILWGKLFPKEAFGPRCPEHAEKHLGMWYVEALRQGWAIFDLRGLTRDDRPPVDELLGADPEWTGGLSVDDYMDEARLACRHQRVPHAPTLRRLSGVRIGRHVLVR